MTVLQVPGECSVVLAVSKITVRSESLYTCRQGAWALATLGAAKHAVIRTNRATECIVTSPGVPRSFAGAAMAAKTRTSFVGLIINGVQARPPLYPGQAPLCLGRFGWLQSDHVRHVEVYRNAYVKSFACLSLMVA